MPKASLIIKLVIFTVRNNQLLILLDNNHLIRSEFSGSNSLDDMAKKLFTDTTKLSLDSAYTEQLYTFSQQKNGEVAIVYYLLLSENPTKLTKNLAWQETKSFAKLSSDGPIIQYAMKRLQWKIEYTNVVYSLLHRTFTLGELQHVYEIILDKKLDKRNFRKKILSLDFITATNQTRITTARPALLYKFKQRKSVFVKVF